MTGPRPPGMREGALLLVGYAALTLSIHAARLSPATGYELSIYTQTPHAVWLGLALALVVATAVTVNASAGGASRLGLLLVGSTFLTFVSLPVIRGYHFYGQTDALTHLGLVKTLDAGSITPFDVIYPGLHSVAASLTTISGLEPRRSLLLLVILFSLVYLIFVPLTVRTIDPRPRVTAIATLSAVLLLPITTISTHAFPHAMSIAILFSPVFVYLLVRYVTTSRATLAVSSVGFILAATSAAVVLYHPQLAAHLVVFLLGICAIQFAARRAWASSPLGSSRPVYAQTGLLVVLYLLWTAPQGFFLDMGERVGSSALAYLLGGRTGPPAEELAAQEASLLAIGVGLEEIFAKLFLVSLVYVVASGVLVLVAMARREEPAYAAVFPIGTSMSAGLAILGLLFLVYFASVTSEMYFRVFGLMMVFVTILGALAFDRGVTALGARTSPASARSVLVVVLVVLVALSSLTVFTSPYIYKQSHHVSEMEFAGHEAALAHAGPGVEFVGVGRSPDRYVDAIEGGPDRSSEYEAIPAEAIESGLATYDDDGYYLIVTELDERREVDAYREVRYTARHFGLIRTERDADRVVTTGEVEVYSIRGST